MWEVSELNSSRAQGLFDATGNGKRGDREGKIVRLEKNAPLTLEDGYFVNPEFGYSLKRLDWY